MMASDTNLKFFHPTPSDP